MSGMVSSSWPWSQRRLCGPAACLCEDVDVVCVKRLFFVFVFVFLCRSCFLLFLCGVWIWKCLIPVAPGLVSLVDEGGERLEEDDQGAGRKRKEKTERRARRGDKVQRSVFVFSETGKRKARNRSVTFFFSIVFSS